MPTEELAEQEILSGADERIRRHRTADMQVRLTYAGKPMVGAKVELEQVRHDFLFGANIFGMWEVEAGTLRQAYLDHFAALLNYATFPFYWAQYEKERGKTRAAEMRQCAEWCQPRGIVPKAHPLIFNTSAGVPKWLPEDPSEVVRLVHQYIEQCVSAFAGAIDVFDVVNEPVAITRFNNPLTKAWQSVGQVEFARQAFQVARRANPKATLLVNDYVLDEKYESVLEGLVDDEGRPLYDAVGIQSHMHAGVWPVEWQWKCCETFSRFGKPLHFTEISILSGPITGPKSDKGRGETTPEGEAEQAAAAEQLYTVLFSHPAVEAITWWALTERRPWPFPPTTPLRKDMTPKPAYDRLMGLIKGKWWTRASGRTGADGAWRGRAFYGRHRLRITAPNGNTHEAQLQVCKGGRTEFQIEL